MFIFSSSEGPHYICEFQFKWKYLKAPHVMYEHLIKKTNWKAKEGNNLDLDQLN